MSGLEIGFSLHFILIISKGKFKSLLEVSFESKKKRNKHWEMD